MLFTDGAASAVLSYFEKMIKYIKRFTTPFILIGNKLRRDHVTAFAAESAFFILLSVIPFLLFFTSLLKFTPVTEEYILGITGGWLPENMSVYLEGIFDEVYRSSTGVLPVSIVAAVLTSAKSIHYMMDGFNAMHGIIETRNWFALRLRSTIYMLVFVLALLLIFVFLVFGSNLEALASAKIPFVSGVLKMRLPVRYLIAFLFLTVFFALLFYVLPNKKLNFFTQLPGALLCSVGWFGFTFGLNMYVTLFDGFSVYGSLTTLMLCMLWVYICMIIMFFCVEVNIYCEDAFLVFFIKRKSRRSGIKEDDDEC